MQLVYVVPLSSSLTCVASFQAFGQCHRSKARFSTSNNLQISVRMSLPLIAPQQLQYNWQVPPHTLPPLQGQHGGLSMHSIYGQSMSTPHTPISAASSTPGTAGNGGFQQMGGQSTLREYHLRGASYHQPMQSNTALSSMMLPGSTAMSHLQTHLLHPMIVSSLLAR